MSFNWSEKELAEFRARQEQEMALKRETQPANVLQGVPAKIGVRIMELCKHTPQLQKVLLECIMQELEYYRELFSVPKITDKMLETYIEQRGEMVYDSLVNAMVEDAQTPDELWEALLAKRKK